MVNLVRSSRAVWITGGSFLGFLEHQDGFQSPFVFFTLNLAAGSLLVAAVAPPSLYVFMIANRFPTTVGFTHFSTPTKFIS